MPHGYHKGGNGRESRFRDYCTSQPPDYNKDDIAKNAAAIARALKESDIIIEQTTYQTPFDKLKSLSGTIHAHPMDVAVCTLKCSDVHMKETLALLNKLFKRCLDYKILQLSAMDKHSCGFHYSEGEVQFSIPAMGPTPHEENASRHSKQRERVHKFLSEIEELAKKVALVKEGTANDPSPDR